jgi:thiamine biosynthesis lipoprotein
MIKNEIKKIAFFFAVVSMGFCALAACNQLKVKPVQSDIIAMGTVISQTVYGENAQEAVKEVNRRIYQLEKNFTVNGESGDIAQINHFAGKRRVKIDEETAFLLNKSLEFTDLSGGAFDITMGPLIQLWGIATENQKKPADGEIESALSLCGREGLVIDMAKGEAGLKKAGQSLNLGAIAKGYAGDIARDIYKKHGIESAIINLGGNVVTVGNRPDGQPWSVGLRNPRHEGENDSLVATLQIKDLAMVTSGDYERFFIENGVRYHHILDPESGKPADSGLLSVTIVAPSSTDADALSTAIFVLGLEKGLELLRDYEDASAVFITENKEIYITEKLKDCFKMEDGGGKYRYIQEK